MPARGASSTLRSLTVAAALLSVASPRQAFWNHQGWLVQLFERPVARYPLLLLLLLPPGDVKLLRWQACEAPLGAKVVTGAAQVCTRSA